MKSPMASDHASNLRRTARRHELGEFMDEVAVRELREAADALEAFEAVDRDRLEHEAVTSESGLPPFSESVAYHAWVRARDRNRKDT